MAKKEKLDLYTTTAQIEAACVAFGKSAVALETEAHKIACSVLKHVGQHSDVRVVARFLEQMPGSYRVNPLREWFETFGPIVFQAGKPCFAKGKTTKLGEAMALPFWKLKAETAYVPLDAVKALDGLVKRLEKDTKETGRDHTAIIAALKVIPAGAPASVTVQ